MFRPLEELELQSFAKELCDWMKQMPQVQEKGVTVSTFKDLDIENKGSGICICNNSMMYYLSLYGWKHNDCNSVLEKLEEAIRCLRGVVKSNHCSMEEYEKNMMQVLATLLEIKGNY